MVSSILGVHPNSLYRWVQDTKNMGKCVSKTWERFSSYPI
ncbi:hypothetical protein AB3329_08200 [Streptococcus sp. H31]